MENQSMAKDQADIVHNFDLGMFDGLQELCSQWSDQAASSNKLISLLSAI